MPGLLEALGSALGVGETLSLVISCVHLTELSSTYVSTALLRVCP